MSTLRVHDFVTSKGEGAANEDAGGWAPAAAWVVDGATDVDDYPGLDTETGAAWIATRVNKLLAIEMSPYPADDPIGTVGRLLEQEVQQIDALQGRVPPACSCGVLYLRDNAIVVDLIGDIFAYLPASKRLISNPAFADNEAAAVRARSPDAVAGIRQRRLGYIVGLDGRWVLSATAKVKFGVQRSVISGFDCGTPFLLCSDGFARAITSYNMFPDWETLYAEVAVSGLAAVEASIRAFEDQHRTALHFKSRDDIYALTGKIDQL